MRQSAINRRSIFMVILSVVMLFASGSSFATSEIAARVAGFCAPAMTSPPVSSCSSCHTSILSRSADDLTPAGARSQAGDDISFCPASATPPAAPPTTPPPGDGTTPAPPTTGMGMSGETTPDPGVGMGVGGSMDDDDDDDDDHDDDDDDDDGMVEAILNVLGFGTP